MVLAAQSISDKAAPNSLPAVVQNPVTTALWLVACCQIIAPMFSFLVDCNQFCNSKSRPGAVVTAVYVVVVTVGCLLGPHAMFQGHGSYFNLPIAYRYKAYVVNVFSAITYVVALRCTRLLLNRSQRRVAVGNS